MADVPGLEPRTTESKSVVLPLHHTPINFGTLAQTRTERTLPFERSDFANLSTRAVNALVGMRILNCTVCGITAQVNSVHFNITDFFIYKKISHPRYRPFAPCLKCRAQSSLLGYFTLFSYATKQKTLGFLVLGSLDVEYAILLYSVSSDPGPAIIIHLNRKPQGGAGALTWCQ